MGPQRRRGAAKTQERDVRQQREGALEQDGQIGMQGKVSGVGTCVPSSGAWACLACHVPCSSVGSRKRQGNTQTWLDYSAGVLARHLLACSQPCSRRVWTDLVSAE